MSAAERSAFPCGSVNVRTRIVLFPGSTESYVPPALAPSVMVATSSFSWALAPSVKRKIAMTTTTTATTPAMTRFRATFDRSAVLVVRPELEGAPSRSGVLSSVAKSRRGYQASGAFLASARCEFVKRSVTLPASVAGYDAPVTQARREDWSASILTGRVRPAMTESRRSRGPGRPRSLLAPWRREALRTTLWVVPAAMVAAAVLLFGITYRF